MNLRYRLLPVFYAAAHENYETGEPLLRRLDLDYPQFAEAGRDDEFLLGKNILVAPVLQGSMQIVPADWLKTPDGQPGLQAEFFTNEGPFRRAGFHADGRGHEFRLEQNQSRAGFSAHAIIRRAGRGTIEVPASVGDVRLATLADDGARVWVDGQLVIDAWGRTTATTSEATAVLTAGQPHQLRIEYLQLEYNAVMRLQWQSGQGRSADTRCLVPPGNWMDAWTGERISGPVTVTNDVPLDQNSDVHPIGRGAAAGAGDAVHREKPWNPVTLDLYPRAGETNTAQLYEDDTLTTAYQRGQFRNTADNGDGGRCGQNRAVKIGAAVGKFNAALKERAWTLRIHSPVDWPKNLAPAQVRVNGKNINAPVHRVNRDATAMPFGDPAGAPDADVFEVTLPAAPVSHPQAVEVSFAPAH